LATPTPRRKVSQPLTLIAYKVHTLGELFGIGLDPDPSVPVGAAETREAAENAITRMEMRERRIIVSRTSLIRICADHGYLTTHGPFTGMTESS
jgi:hypothetical protein